MFPLLLLVRQLGLPDPRGPAAQVCLRASGSSTLFLGSAVNQKLPWVAPIDSSQHAERPHSVSPLGFMVTQTLSLLFFHHRVEFFFIFLCLCWFFPPALSFQDYHRKYSIQHEFPRGLLGRGFNIHYSVFLFFSFSLSFDTSDSILPIATTPPPNTPPYIWLLLSAHKPERITDRELSYSPHVQIVPNFSITKLYLQRWHMLDFSGPPQFQIIFSSSQWFQALVWKIRSQQAARSHTNELILSNYCIDVFFLCSLGKPSALEKYVLQLEIASLFSFKPKGNLPYCMAQWRPWLRPTWDLWAPVPHPTSTIAWACTRMCTHTHTHTMASPYPFSRSYSEKPQQGWHEGH